MYNRPPIGEILIRRGAVSRDALGRALEEQQQQSLREGEKPLRIGQILIEEELIDEMTLLHALGDQYSLEVREAFDTEEVDTELSRDLSYAFCMQRLVMPFERRFGLVMTAIHDPLDLDALDMVRAQTGSEPLPVLAPAQSIRELITAVYDRRGDLDQLVDDLDRNELAGPGDLEDAFEKIEDLLSRGSADDEGPIIQLVNTIFQQAVRERASDIHIEPMEEYVLVRFRVDGILQEAVRAPKRFQNSIVVRIKIMSDLNIAEKRLPQDGRIRFRIAGRDIDVRVATAPASQGERITMRLLDRNAILLDLSELGFSPRAMNTVHNAIHQPHGIVLVTGPTGSGKTTTLYACLSKINQPDKNILTVEDPVEYQLPGISQMQVNPKIELTFASGLRSYLRHDPDVIMVGEIRDVETAEIAIQASLTGHLVLSTIHTNDSAGAFTRLIDMGVEPFLVSSSLTLAMAQRLVRRLCPVCKLPYEPTDAEMRTVGMTRAQLESAEGVIYKPSGEGCSECTSGYSGRAGIYEMLPVDDTTRQMVMQRADASTIRAEAAKRGMITMRDDGVHKVLRGMTSIAEVLRVTADDALVV